MAVEVIHLVIIDGTISVVTISLPESRWVGICGKGPGYTSSITSSAATTETGDPIAMLWTYW